MNSTETSNKKIARNSKTLTVQQLLRINHADVSHLLSEPLRKSLGAIDDAFDIFIYGNSGDGKSSFSGQLIKQLSPLGRILHLTYEEGHSQTAKLNIIRSGLTELKEYRIRDNCSFEELMALLAKRSAPKIVVIDSWQYARFTKDQWLTLKDMYVKGRKKKIFIVISHADGKKPRGSSAIDAMYDAQIKVFVKGKIAFVKSRYEGSGNYVIWEEGAKQAWGRNYKKMLTKQIF